MKRLQHCGLRRAAGGFTLVELMVTVLIVGILASVAYPAYRSHIVKTHRNAAKACLSQYVQYMERYYTTELTYATVAATPALACATASGLGDRYDFNVRDPTPTATAYTAKATPKGQQLGDTKCGTLSIKSTGERTASGTAAASCW